MTLLSHDCDKEPVQFMDSIQNFGSIIVVDKDDRIVQAAFNATLPKPRNFQFGERFSDLFPQIAASTNTLLQSRTEPTVPMLIRSSSFEQWLTCVAHRSDSYRVYELETSPDADSQIPIPTIKLRSERDESIESYLSFIAENLQQATAYDRVLAYRFASDWHGEVVAEALSPRSQQHSFFNHHFPASDIPEPARELFRQNWIRIICNVDSPTIPIEKAPGHHEKVNLGRSSLRAASPIHIYYLKFMGVKASMTLSLICDGKLWGLLACHHFSPKFMPTEHRSVLGLISKMISARITAINSKTILRNGEYVERFLASVATGTQSHSLNISELVRDNKVAIHKIVSSDSFAYLDGVEVVTGGNCPNRANLHRLHQFLDQCKSSLVVTSCLGAIAPHLADMAEQCAGLLAVKIKDSWFAWLRVEQSQLVTWAGNPEYKDIFAKSADLKMSPRLSFESWKEQTKGRSADWSQTDVDIVEKLKHTLDDIDRNKGLVTTVDLSNFSWRLQQSIELQARDLDEQLHRQTNDVIKDIL